MEKKEEIRDWIRKKLNELSEEEREEKSKKIKDNLLNHLFFKKSKNIFIYLSFQKEVDTFSIIQDSLKIGKNILVPWTKDENNIVPVILENLDELEKGMWGIFEPSKKNLFPKEDIELIILPGIAFDRKGNRLGRGKGFYDRFLNSISPDKKKIALAYSFQIVDFLPRDSHDVPVDEIITENGKIIKS